MNIDTIKEIIESKKLADDDKRRRILYHISQDTNWLEDVLEMIAIDKAQKKELIGDLNLEVSRLHIAVIEPKHFASKKDRQFLLDNVEALYKKWKGVVSHCFNKFN